VGSSPAKTATMQALVLGDRGVRFRTDVPVPELEPGWARIRVRMAGICATDLALVAGYKGGYRGILGHEFVGQVEDAPEHPEWVGRRVVGEINIGCGGCERCRRGLAKHCRRRRVLGIWGHPGAFATYLALPVANLHPVPPHLPDAHAVFVEPLAAALQILEQVSVRPDTRAYVLGDGRLGLLVAQVLAQTGCDLLVLGRNPDKLAILDARGIATVSVAGEVPEELLAAPADVVVEVTGSPAGFQVARSLVRPGGTLVLKSTFPGGIDAFDVSGLVVDEVTVVGSRCGPFPPALRLLARQAIQVEPLIQRVYPLEEGVTALEDAARKGVLKVLLRV